jgi:hypothetical protein
MITRGDFLIDMTDEITEYGYSSPAVTPDGDVYFVRSVHAKLTLPAPVVSYRLLRIRNTWYPRTGN